MGEHIFEPEIVISKLEAELEEWKEKSVTWEELAKKNASVIEIVTKVNQDGQRLWEKTDSERADALKERDQAIKLAARLRVVTDAVNRWREARGLMTGVTDAELRSVSEDLHAWEVSEGKDLRQSLELRPRLELLNALEKAFDGCEHPYTAQSNTGESSWCNLCGAWRGVSKGRWHKPHWRDLLAKVVLEKT